MITNQRISPVFHIFLGLLSLCIVATSIAETLTGKVVSVYDGDTITLLVDKTQHKIRLEGIDTPETKQPFGTKAKQALSRMVFGKTVEVQWDEKDRYGRTLGQVYFLGKWINLQMVRNGYAWHYKQYSKDKELAEAEIEARKGLRGLWLDKNPIAPWDWRKGNRTSSAQVKPKNPQPTKEAVANVVYITDTGKKYHGAGCRYLKKSKHKVSLVDAKGQGLTACKVCGGR